MQKTKTILAVCCLLFAYTKAQTNLVPNPSFEQYTVCPTGNGNIINCTYWLNFGNTPDYYNGCASPSIMGVPDNFTGFEYPHTGNGMAGLITWYNPSNNGPNYREFVGAQLISTLSMGTKYYFSFFTNYSGYLNGWKEVAANKIGLRLCTKPSDSLNHCAINNFANLYTNTILNDTVNWIKLSGSFIADSAYKYVAIGNFFDDAHTDTSSFAGASFGGEGPYYYIDDICVSTDSIYNQTWTGIETLNNKQSNQVKIYPNPSVDGYFFSTVNINKTNATVYNVLGSIVKQAEFINGNTLNLSDLENGVYIIEFNNQCQSKQKLIINKQ